MGPAIRTTLIAVALVAVVAALATFAVLRYGLAADRSPGVVETAVARRLVLLSIPSATRAMANPLAADRDAWRAGAQHFGEHCAVCHGSDGRATSPLSKNMYPPVPDLASAAVQNKSDGALFAIIQNGVRWTGMPAFRAEHNAEEIWKLVAFIRNIPKLPPESPRHAHDDDESDRQEGNTVTMDGTTFSPGELTVALG